jgi:hypothetical protein
VLRLQLRSWRSAFGSPPGADRPAQALPSDLLCRAYQRRWPTCHSDSNRRSPAGMGLEKRSAHLRAGSRGEPSLSGVGPSIASDGRSLISTKPARRKETR